MKHIFIAAALILMVSGSAYADSSATAVADQGQTQTQVGGMGSADANAQQGQTQGIFIGGGGVGGQGAGASGASILGGGAAATGGTGGTGGTGIGVGGRGGSVANSGNSSVGINNSFNGAPPIRYLPVPSAVPMENYQPSILARPDYADKGPNFMSMRQIVGMMNYVDLNVPTPRKRGVTMTAQIMRPADIEEHQKAMEQEGFEHKPVTFDINDGKKVNGGFKPLAIITIQSDKPTKINSASLAIMIGKEARKYGASKVIFLTEGSTKELSSWGVGIGLAFNHATVDSKPSGSGSVGSGGTGWSMGKARYFDLIYLTAVVGN